MTTDYEAQISEYTRAVDGGLNTWVAACGGKEPISEIEGRHYQYMFNPRTKDHAYYNFEDDLFLERDQLPECLR